MSDENRPSDRPQKKDRRPFNTGKKAKPGFGPKKPFAGDTRPDRAPARKFGGDRDRPFRGPSRDDRGPPREDRGAPRGAGGPPRFDRKPAPFRREERAGPQEGGNRPHLGDDELRYLGKNACLALLAKRPEDIVRIYVLRELASEYKPLIEYCTTNRKSFHLVDAPDLERLTDSVHHQGIVVVARARQFVSEKRFFGELGAKRTLVLFLDGVGNPHNLGAILRTAAHFGVNFVCVPEEELSKISPAIYRTAEGAAEIVSIVRVEDSEKFLDQLQHSGFHLYAFEAANSQSVFETRLNEKSVFVFGAEVEGISGLVRSIVETRLSIPGTGAVESLNVSVAAAIAMAEFGKQGTQKSVRIVKTKA